MNTFRLFECGLYTQDSQQDNALTTAFWRRYAEYFHHLVTAFDVRQAYRTELGDILEALHWDGRWLNQHGNVYDRTRAKIHISWMSTLERTFRNKDYLIGQKATHLETVTLDFSNLVGPDGCCRQKALKLCYEAFETLQGEYPFFYEPLARNTTVAVTLTGFWADEERSFVKHRWGRRVNLTVV